MDADQRADWEQQMDNEKRRAAEEAWEAHIAYVARLFSSPSRGQGPGNYYKALYSGFNNEHVEQVRK